jgi:hypothetical protein
MPNSVAHLVFRAVVVVLGKVRAANLLQMAVVFGEVGSMRHKRPDEREGAFVCPLSLLCPAPM